MKTFFYTILFSLLFMAGQASAYSNLQCTSNEKVLYGNRSLVGGVKPFPGMVIRVEEIQIGDDIAYRLVTRQSCEGHPDCQPQNPELQDILPSGFTFAFYPATKVVLAMGADSEGRTEETYAIQFSVGHMRNIWMLCNYWQILAP